MEAQAWGAVGRGHLLKQSFASLSSVSVEATCLRSAAVGQSGEGGVVGRSGEEGAAGRSGEGGAVGPVRPSFGSYLDHRDSVRGFCQSDTVC